jgi:hypothetical protein
MLEKFYLKYFLFIIIIFLLTLIITKKNEGIIVFIKETSIDSEDYLIYLADYHNSLFPLNIIVNDNNNDQIDFYQDKINTSFDKQVYLTFAFLTNYCNYLPQETKTYIPSTTRLLDYDLVDGLLVLNVSEAFLDYNKRYEKEMLKILVYTFSNLEEVKGIKLFCNNQELNFDTLSNTSYYPEDFLLNSYINNNDISDLEVIKLYYLTIINNDYYLVPVIIFDNIEMDKEARIKTLLVEPVVSSLVTKVDHENNFSNKLAYYQYYLTLIDNNISKVNFNIKITDINNYDLNLSIYG